MASCPAQTEATARGFHEKNMEEARPPDRLHPRMLLAMGPAPDEPADLAARMRDGDARAFEAWVRTQHELVYRLCRRLVPDAGEAEDAVQETFVRAWRSAPQLRDPAAHRTWVCRIARRVCADRARAAPPRAAVDVAPEALAADQRGPDEALEAARLRARVTAAIDRLRPKHRIVLVLREIDGFDYEAIADALDIPRGTVESRLHRARAELARALERDRKTEDRRTS
jgi:RNA polymerase sigma-70 factor (ECF subfamily)